MVNIFPILGISTVFLPASIGNSVYNELNILLKISQLIVAGKEAERPTHQLSAFWYKMKNLFSEIIRLILKGLVDMGYGILGGFLDMVLVVSGIVFALLFLVISLWIWLMGYKLTALLNVILLLGMTSMWITKERARTPHQREKKMHALRNWFKAAVHTL